MVGQRIGNYRVIRQLGEGGMGVVYEAVRDDIGGRAAIKVLRPEFALHPETAARFFNEARAANLIDNAGIVKIFDYGQLPNGAAFLAMEYLSGESLHGRIGRERRISEADTIRLGRQMATALSAAHAKQVIHRDLKPENIFIVPDAEAPSGERAKILDFGIAKLAREHTGSVRTQTNVVMGTPIYMSPEQCKGGKHVDDRADVYALGVILFEMLTGRPPFVAEEPGEYIGMHLFQPPPPLGSLLPTATPALLRLVDSMLLKDPQARPAMLVVARVLKELGNFSSDVVSVHALAEGSDVETQVIKRIQPPRKFSGDLKPILVPPVVPPINQQPNQQGAAPQMTPLRIQGRTPLPAGVGPLDPPTIPDEAPPRFTPSLLPPGAQAPPSPSSRPGAPGGAPDLPTPQILPRIEERRGARNHSGPDDATALIGASSLPLPTPLPAVRAATGSGALPPDWQPVVVSQAAAIGNLDPESLHIEDSERRGRSFSKQLRRIRFRLKKRIFVLLGLPVVDQRSTPSGTRTSNRRVAFIVGTVAVVVAIIVCVIVLLAWQPSAPASSDSSSPAVPPHTPTPAPPKAPPAPEEPPGPPLPSDIADVLANAKKLDDAGDLTGALKLARGAARRSEHPAAWTIVGQYACQDSNMKLANQALDHVKEDTPLNRRARAEIYTTCTAYGATQDSSGHLSKPN